MTLRHRALSRITLADQLVAWKLWRDGKTVEQISDALNRQQTGARRVLFGDSSI